MPNWIFQHDENWVGELHEHATFLHFHIIFRICCFVTETRETELNLKRMICILYRK